jgi:hypothetical protein
MKAVRALVLVLALSVCAHAGLIPIDGRPQPEPTPTTSTETAGSDPDSGGTYGDIQNGLTTTEAATEAALNLIGVVLALL